MKPTNIELDDIIKDVDDMDLIEELRSLQLFLVDSELKRSRHKVFSNSVENLSETVVNEKLEFNLKCSRNLYCAAEINLTFRYFLKITEDGYFRFFSAHENNTLPD